MPFGAEIIASGAVRFALWAPAQAEVGLQMDGAAAPLVMTPKDDGWHELTTDQAAPGSLYRFVLGDGLRVPDPASRHQPADVHGPSEVIDPKAYVWSDEGWTGRPWHESVISEVHIGTFTPEGTFQAAIAKLDHLVALGVTVVEIMPVADFPGGRNWGYDGVLPFAPDAAYGRPEDLKALIDAAHSKGLSVFLDVVYNHFGPEGNYLGLYAPQFFTERHHTPWGAAINYDGPDSPAVRAFVIHNALYWIEEFHLDGLRLDAVHAIIDDSPKHLLEDLAERVHGLGRPVHLVLENDANQARFLSPKWYAAQWNDDLHHCLHVAVSGEDGGYYGDYADGVGRLGRALAEGFAYQGEASAYRDGQQRGEPSGHLSPLAFIGFLQNHDQIGNRAFGERLTALAPREAVRAAAAISLLCPSPPLLFMGEEWAADQPFPFFCDFNAELSEAVRQGRRAEFAKFPAFSASETLDRLPDPAAAETFVSARLDWSALDEEPHREWLDWYSRVLATRHREIIPRLAGTPGGAASFTVVGAKSLRVDWRLGDGSGLILWANLGEEPAEPLGTEGKVIWREGDGPWAVTWAIVEAP
jgi:malto-oligosyltrehalose trehalohydrolase